MLPNIGQIIKLVSMPDDPCPIAAGTMGVVTGVYPVGGGEYQIHVKWENGRRLMLIYPVDTFMIVGEGEWCHEVNGRIRLQEKPGW